MIINKEYIGVIREENGYLVYYEDPIPQDKEIINIIQKMIEDDNYTLLNIQNIFIKIYPESSCDFDGWYCLPWFNGGFYNYIYPHDYDSSYIHGAKYPNIISEQEYTNLLQKEEEKLRKEQDDNDFTNNSLELLRRISPKDYSTKICQREEMIATSITKYKQKLKLDFCYKDFLSAHFYRKKLDLIKKNKTVRMYSTEQIGWKEFEYIINDDITIYVDTNFGYGSASYFYCNLKYKDINILPYTDIIKYYYVEMTDFIRHTRSYALTRESWKQVFDFVVQKVNLAKHETELFINWIVNEIEEMMKGIREIMKSPTSILETYLEIKPIDIGSYKICRNCSISDKKDYEVLPNEKVIAFKVEKITGCLYLLDNLNGLVELAPVITPYIREIEQMNLQIQPEIDTHINNLINDICKLNKDLKQLIKEIEKLSPLLDIHKKNIEALRQLTKKDKGYLPSIQNTEAEYIKGHPEYINLEMEVNSLMQQKNKLHEHINRRDGFLKILQECKGRINKFIPIA